MKIKTETQKLYKCNPLAHAPLRHCNDGQLALSAQEEGDLSVGHSSPNLRGCSKNAIDEKRKVKNKAWTR